MTVGHADTAMPLDKIVAVVKNHVITQDQLMVEVNRVKQEIVAHGQQPPPNNVLMRQVLNKMISDDLQIQLAKRMKVTITDKHLDATIQQIAKHNHIAVNVMLSTIQAHGMSIKAYRAMLRKQLTIHKLQGKIVARRVKVTKQDIAKVKEVLLTHGDANTEYHLLNILLPLPAVPTSAQITTTKAKAKKIIAELRQGKPFSQIAIAQSGGQQALQGGDLGWRRMAGLPDIFAKAVKHMKINQVSAAIRTGNGFHILKLIAKRNKNFGQKVIEYHVRQIYLKKSNLLSADQIRQRMQRLRKLLKQGESFAKLAKQSSQDEKSATKGGDMGWLIAGQVSNTFAQYMQALPNDGISQPFESANGWHIIQVVGKKTVNNSSAYLDYEAKQLAFQKKFVEKKQLWLQQLRSGTYIKTFLN